MPVALNPDIIEKLTVKTVELNLYLSLFIFIFGIIGNILNILVLTQRSLRSNSCIYLFLLSSIANLISILFGLTPRILSHWKFDLTETSDLPCKLRAFITFSSRTIALWLIMLATIDRWLTSSYNIYRRKLSSLKNAQYGTITITIFSILSYSQMLVCYQSNLLNTPLKCYGKTSFCRLLTDITYSCLTILFPLILMTIFGSMTISNIRQTRVCMKPQKPSSEKCILKEEVVVFLNQPKQRWKKLERYLRRMLFLQVILLILLTFPQAIHKLYFTLTSNQSKTARDYEFDQFLYKFELLLPYLESALPFYIYTLTGGDVFRNALQKLIRCSR